MAVKKIDKRVTKTKNNIYNALLELLQEKQIEEIRVSEICKNASINRTTFYAHFKDKHDLFNTYIKSIQQELIKNLENIKHQKQVKQYYLEITSILINYMEEKKDIYKIITNHKQYDIIIHTIQENIKNILLTNNYNDKIGSIPRDFITTFYIGGIVNIGMDWVLNRPTYSKQTILKHMEELISNAFK